MLKKDLEQLGQNVAKLRIAKQLKQSELAYEAGVSERTLQRIEAGEVVKTDGLVKVIRQLGRIDEFLSAFATAAFSTNQLALQVKGAKSGGLAKTYTKALADLNDAAKRPKSRVRDSAKSKRDKRTTGNSPQKLVWPEDRE